MTPRALFENLRAFLSERVPASLGLLPEGVTAAGVLVPLFEKQGEPHLLFLKRPEGNYRHAGQIAFPGGVRDGDELPLQCALREAREEVGLDPRDVDVLGRLDEYDTVVTGFRVSPVVGVIPYPYPFKPDPYEVERLIEVPLSVLAAPENRRVQMREVRGESRPIHFFTAGEDVIWGVTGGMLAPLLEIIQDLRCGLPGK